MGRLCLKAYRGRIEVSLLLHGFAQGRNSLTVCAAAHHLAGELVDINNETVILYASIIAQWAN